MLLYRFFEWLAPEETATQTVLPVTFLLRTGPMIGLIALVVNDHALKGAGLLPGVVTGKLSDFAGLFFFPLLLVTLLNLTARSLARFSDALLPLASPSRNQIITACIATGVFFSGVQLWEPIADFYSTALAHLQIWHDVPRVEVTQDPLDLIALPSLVVCYYWSLDGLRRFPPGRLAVMRAALSENFKGIGNLNARERISKLGILDIYVLHGDAGRTILEELSEAIHDNFPVHKIDELLTRLRTIAKD
jgi:hypothetical protein